MDAFNSNKKYESIKIPGQQQFIFSEDSIELPQNKSSKPSSSNESLFYEIEYNSCPFPGVGKFVLKPQKIEEPEKDETRELFGRMREISRSHRSIYDSSRFFDQRVQNNNAIIFYKQGMFMKDFSDNYSGNRPFTQYFPNYQMMGYEQLRTYFTWRTEIRKGNVTDNSLSYAFLYIYELLANIGVNDPMDGLDQLMSFWKAYRTFNTSIDKYVQRWLKDYHVYYRLPHSFKEFIDKNDLSEYYPKMADSNDSFDLFCTISKYDIRKSTFFADDKIALIKDCFYFVISELRQITEDNGFLFDETVFQPTRKMTEWKPFKDALFYPWLKQPDRRIVLCENEIYICRNNKWFFNSVITSENGRKLIGYIMKQMEHALRKATNYKFKLSADINTLTHEAIDILKKAGLSLEAIINDAVARFYKEATKTVVIVDPNALSRIRQEALLTQEKLIVPEQEKPLAPPIVLQQDGQLTQVISAQQEKKYVHQEILDFSSAPKPDMPPISQPQPDTLPSSLSDDWLSLRSSLSQIELEALSVVLQGEMDLKIYADECGIMLEVLVDGINEKALDYIGDNLLDEEFVLYDDYKEQVKELIE